MQIYLSPHHDDVCFSLGDMAFRRGGELVNIFTRSDYLAARMLLPTSCGSRADLVSEIRRGEDRRFAEAANLNRHDLGLSEPALVGHRPFDLTGLRQEVELLQHRLIPRLEAMLPTDSVPDAATIYCPLGIGGHRNHLAVLLAVQDNFAALSRRCDVRFYEDLHYASDAAVRDRGIARARKILAGIDLVPQIMTLDAEAAVRKMDAIRFYASQHASPPLRRHYTPASFPADAMHEIVYSCDAPHLDAIGRGAMAAPTPSVRAS